MKKVLVIGSGPIVIGQGAEFDYSGTQACLALKEEGHEIILINNNPATIMTDQSIVDKVYFEPLEYDYLKQIIETEQPDLLLPTLGGQTGLNLAYELSNKDVLDKYNVEVIGTSLETIKLAEDREAFKNFLIEIDEPVIESKMVSSVEEGLEFANYIGYPLVVRPAYTLGGTGGGLVYSEEELIKKIKSGTNRSIVGQVLIEKSIAGYKEIEYEVMRDSNGTCIIVCNMENIDPVGVHTGDSIVVAPSQTINDKEYQMLRDSSVKIVDQLGIEGGCNVQLALDPNSQQYYVIEVNPRVSRSSALASKATGYPIAKISTKIALGYDLHEIENDITKKTYASFEPALDYCVVKIPKWPFDKFHQADNSLGTMMKATGEVMAIGDNFEMAFLKAVRALEMNQNTLNYKKAKQYTQDELLEMIPSPCSERIFFIAELLQREVSPYVIHKKTKIDLFFLYKLQHIVEMEKNILNREFSTITMEEFKTLKKFGFSDEGISELVLDMSFKDILTYRKENNIAPAYKMVDTCAGEFEAKSPYYYSTYNGQDEVEVSDNEKVIVLGSGPIRIGQGVEFDYSTVKCILSLEKLGYESIIINNNPETVSTDFDMSDKLYFEPITKEDVLNIIIKEDPKGVVLQFGGQTSIKLAKFLEEIGVPIIGTGYQGIHECESRESFLEILESNELNYPKGIGVNSVAEGVKKSEELSYPLIVRPSYVLGGAGMEIVYNKTGLEKYLTTAFSKQDNSVLIDEYIQGIELEIDAVTDGQDVFIPGIMEHLEEAGVHSGDSIAIYPTLNVPKSIKEEIYEITKKITNSIDMKGLINIQLIYSNQKLYIIEINPRASRTVPFISKVTDTQLVEMATKVMMGDSLEQTGIKHEEDIYAIKGPIFSMDKIELGEIALGPEMKSTGEIMSLDITYDNALYKNFISMFKAKVFNHETKNILISITDSEKEKLLPLVKKLADQNVKLYGTLGTTEYYSQYCDITQFDDEYDYIDFIMNIPSKKGLQSTKGFLLRRASVENDIPILTSYKTMTSFVEILSNPHKHMNQIAL